MTMPSRAPQSVSGAVTACRLAFPLAVLLAALLSTGLAFAQPPPDAYEPDDDAGSANVIATDGSLQYHTLHSAGDTDWLVFQATAGVEYVIETFEVEPWWDTDTVLWLYDGGLQEIARDDDSGGPMWYSRMVWTCTTNGTYLLQVTRWPWSDQLYGTGTYSISITASLPPAIIEAYDAVGRVGETIQLCAKLSDAAGPLIGETIDFTVGAWSGSAVTDSLGLARVSYTIAALGNTDILAEFGGSGTSGPSSDTATLTGLPALPTSIVLSLDTNPVVAGGTTTATVVDNNGVDVTADCALSVAGGGGGGWVANVYTTQNAGTWMVSATYGALSDAVPLAVLHDEAATVAVTPKSSAITMAQTQLYAVTATDAQGNTWTPDPADILWTEDGAGGFGATDNTYTPAAGDEGNTVNITATVDSASDSATLMVYANGPGLVLAWDRTDQRFYLCADPSDPATGTAIPSTNGTHVVNGVTCTVSGASGNRMVVVQNSLGFTNSLRVRWYMRSGRVYSAYMYSTIGAQNRTAFYATNGTTYVDGQYKAGFWGIAHTLDAPDPTTISYSAVKQP